MRTIRAYLDDCRGLWRVVLVVLLITISLPALTVAMPLVERQFIDAVIIPQRFELLPSLVVIYCVLWLASTGAQALGSWLSAFLVEKVALRLRQRLFAQCETLSVAFAHHAHSGQTTALFTSDIPATAGLIGTVAVSPLGSVVAIVVAAVAMFSLSWQLALVAIVAPPLVMLAAAVVTRPLRPASRRAQDKAGDLVQQLQENLAGLREVVAFGREHSQARVFDRNLQELLRARMRVSYLETAIGTGQGLFFLTVSLAVLGYGGYLVVNGLTTLGTLVAMRSLLNQALLPATQLSGRYTAVQRALGAAERLYAFYEQKPRVVERTGAGPLPVRSGALSFEHVGFAYEPGRPVLRDISLSVSPGQLVALVGPSGAGKSTLASLIARFYDPTEGRILIDGNDLRDVQIAELRRAIGMVFQDSFLFATSIRENIAFGRDGASDAEILGAAQAANAWEFIEQLPHGLDTAVGERGVQLSEGQRQRIAIARALLRDPRILILDEPTSALDARSERLLQSALERLIAGRTTFVIAHRLATVLRADPILVLDDGQIVERGSHHELMQQGGLYRELFDLQFGEGPGFSKLASGGDRQPALELVSHA